MKFNVNQQDLQQALNYCQGVIEKRSTLPILSNILLDASGSKLTITATDLDLIFIHQLNNVDFQQKTGIKERQQQTRQRPNNAFPSQYYSPSNNNCSRQQTSCVKI